MSGHPGHVRTTLECQDKLQEVGRRNDRTIMSGRLENVEMTSKCQIDLEMSGRLK